MKFQLKDLINISVLLSIVIICSKISFPVFTIPVTLQTFAIAISSLILKRKVVMLIFLYIILGLIGFPVFSGGGGFSYILQPSFGFIIAFIPFSFLLTFNNVILKYILSIIILYVIGTLYMYFIMNYYNDVEMSMYKIITIFIPFIIKDTLSIFLSVIIYKRVKFFNNLSN